MTRLWINTLVLLLCLTGGIAQAQKIPLLPGLGGEAEQQPRPQPQPTDLQPGWWHYFDAEGEELKQRIQNTVNDLDELLTTLPEPSIADAQAFIDLIKANLNTLPEARNRPATEPPAPPAYAERYSSGQLLQLARRLRDLQAELRVEATDYQIAEEDLAADLRRNDTQSAAYLKLATSDPSRAVKGLQIMAERLALMVTEQRLRLRRAELDAQRLRSQQLVAELDEARERLAASEADLDRLDQAISAVTAERQQAHASVIKELANASSVVGDSAEDKATEQYRQQRVVKAQISEASAKVRLLRLRAERTLNRLLLGQPIDDAAAEVSAWQTELAEVEAQLVNWNSASERERRRAGSAVGNEVKPQESAGYITFLNQDRFALAQESLVAVNQLRDQIAQARLAVQLVDQQLLHQEGVFKRWLSYAQLALGQAWVNASGWANVSLFTIGDTPVTALGVLRIALILTVAWWLSYWIRRVLERLGSKGDASNQSAFYTIGRLSHYVLILLGFLIGLSSIGMDFSNFALVAGALAIGIGFGLQAIVNNFISGLILLFEGSLKVGDFVELASGVTGEVKAINVRSTQIKTNENIDIVVPNSEFMNSNVINWTLQEPYLRVHYPFRVSFGADKNQVRKAGLEAAESVSYTLSGIPGKNPQVWLVGFGDNGYNFELVVWLTPSAVKRPQAVRAAYYWELETALKKYAVKVPVPQRDLYLRSGFGALDAPDEDASDDSAPAAATPAAGMPAAGMPADLRRVVRNT